MATIPKIMCGGIHVTRCTCNGTSLYDIDVVKDGVTTKVFHRHKGSKTSKSGCYTIPVYHVHSDSCGFTEGCTGADAMWWCAECGYEQGKGNRHGSGHYDTCSHYATSDTNNNGCDYHDNEDDCECWEKTYYCGKNESTIESYRPGCGYVASDELIYEFLYTGEIQSFVVPATGTYQLEVYGAQGGNGGGYGGYSKGTVSLTEGQILYIVVGGAGSTAYGGNSGGVNGGYNGGGRAGSDGINWDTTYFGSGGGATHIATASGLLSALESSKSNILIVAGGGGGAAHYDGGNIIAGGTGGGTSGGKGAGSGTQTGNYGGYGGSQSSGGTPNYAGNAQYGAFGSGGDGYSGNGCGGGGGYYGGGGTQAASGAGGGSGYIGNMSDGTTSSGLREGHGYAKISII